MALPDPPLDPRRYQELVDELIARIPVHTPEWTNFNAADPGITLVQLFAHITESLLYRASQIPARNRAKFLQLLGQRMAPATAATGLVAFSNDRGPTQSAVLPTGTELLAGSIPYRTTASLDALPVEARLFIKRPLASPPQELREYYSLLYASYGRTAPDNDSLTLYESLTVPAAVSIDFAATVDRTLWIALLGRDIDRDSGDDPWQTLREALGGRTLSLGLVPTATVTERRLGLQPSGTVASLLRFERPAVEAGLARDAEDRPAPAYLPLPARADADPLQQACVVELTLPAAPGLSTWTDLDPLEAGVGNLPPAIDDADISARLITWIAVRADAASDLTLRWAGINAVPARQYAMVNAEPLAEGDGTPDQQRRLGRAPVLPGSVIITGINGSTAREWREIDDILAAGPEIPVHDAPAMRPGPTDVFVLDAEAAVVSFGDGLTGRRPAAGEALYASYGWSHGAAGNVGAGAVKVGPLLLPGITATNPLPMSGGADAESLAAAEKHIPRILQHRDRLVTASDFRCIAWRTPGVAVGRIDVLPAAHPDIAPLTVGTAPGAVTLLALPAFDPLHPAAPRSNREFLDALCRHLNPRRLVTTELVIRGPDYVGIWISVGIELAGGLGDHGAAAVAAAVTARLTAFLSPLPAPGTSLDDLIPPLFGPEPDPELAGWPLGRAVQARTLLAEVARTPGVVAVVALSLARGSEPAAESVPLAGLELPEILGLSVVVGDPLPLDLVRGAMPATASDPSRLPVPVVAETC